MNQFYDFDAMWAEAMPDETERPKIKVFGETITLPAVLPARIMLKALRYQEDPDRSIVEQIEEYLADLKLFVGAETVERWLDKGIETTQIIQIYTHIIGLYTPKEGDADEGNETTPEEGANPKKQARSSKIGA